jgi:hypothetical protein
MATTPPHTLSSYSVHARRLGSSPPLRLWREVHDYLEHLLEIRVELAQSTDRSIAELAQEGFGRAFQELTRHLPADRLLAKLEEFLAHYASGRLKADDREMRRTLYWLGKRYGEASEGAEQVEDRKKWRLILEKLARLQVRFDDGPFPLRLRIALGDAYDTEKEEVDGKRIYRFEKRCRELAREVVSKQQV